MLMFMLCKSSYARLTPEVLQLPLLSVVIQTNSQAQFHDFELWLEASRSKVKAMTDGIKPVLDLIDPQLSEPDRPP